MKLLFRVWLCVWNFSLHLHRGMSWRTEGRPFHMTSHMIQRTEEAPHLHPRRGYLYFVYYLLHTFYICRWKSWFLFLSIKESLMISWPTFLFFLFFSPALDFSWLGVWCPESCIWRFQCLRFCLWPNGLGEILHHDGPHSKALSQLSQHWSAVLRFVLRGSYPIKLRWSFSTCICAL